MKSTLLCIFFMLSISLYSQNENKDILLIHAAQIDSQNGVFPSTGVETWYGQTTQLSKSDISIDYNVFAL